MRAPPAPQDERWRAVEAALAGLPTPPDVRNRFDAIRDCKLTAREYARLLRGGVDVIRQTLRDPTDRQAFENLVPELLAEAAALDRFGGRPKALPRDRLLVFWHQKLGGSWEIATPDGNPPRGAVIDYLIAAVRYVSGDVIGPEAAKKIVRAHKAIRFPIRQRQSPARSPRRSAKTGCM